MTEPAPLRRVRLFAGPNGSGKSTLHSLLSPRLLGLYLNGDEIEAQIRAQGMFDFSAFGPIPQAEKVLAHLTESAFLKRVGLQEQAQRLKFQAPNLLFGDVSVNSYFASVIADFLRHFLLEAGTSFTFESVMSSPDKVAFLQKAPTLGFRTYLYFVATRDPMLNISRVQNRVQLSGHEVPEAKIVARYTRSLALQTAPTFSIIRGHSRSGSRKLPTGTH